MTARWDLLRRRLAGGQVITPGSAAFEAARLGFNRRFHAIRPQAIVRCTSAGEAAQTIAFARDHGMDLAIRSGGHCFAGRSATTGVVIDVSPMSSVQMDGEAAVIGAGTRLGRAYAVLDERGRAIPGGTCPSVGIAGLTLGGGLGILGRQYGMTADRLTAARVVLASGEIIDCDEHQHPDLLWALRGAGAGNFGVVTSLTLRTVPAPAQTWSRHLAWPAAEAGNLIDAWQRWAPAAPGSVAASLKITASAEPGTEPSVDVYVTGLGPGTGPQITEDLVRRAGCPPVSVTEERGPFRDARRFWARLGAGAAPRGSPESPWPSPHAFLFSRSEFFGSLLPGAAISALISVFCGDREPGVSRELDFMPWAGAYRRSSPSDAAFSQADGLFQLKHSATVEGPVPVGTRDRAHRWVTRSWETVHPWGTGRVFPNFADAGLKSPAACYGASLARLSEVKARYDPGNAFRFRQSIPLP